MISFSHVARKYEAGNRFESAERQSFRNTPNYAVMSSPFSVPHLKQLQAEAHETKQCLIFKNSNFKPSGGVAGVGRKKKNRARFGGVVKLQTTTCF